MSDTGSKGSDHIVAADMETGGDDGHSGIRQSVSQAEIEDILNSPDMLIEEKQARLHELSQRIGYRDDVDQGEDFDPLGLQISEALNLLADGGHTYSAFGDTGLDLEGRSDASSPDDVVGSEDDGDKPR